MAQKFKFTIDEMKSELDWSDDQIASEFDSSRTVQSLLRGHYTKEETSALVVWNDYYDRFDVNEAAMKEWLATSFTGRDVKIFEASSFTSKERGQIMGNAAPTSGTIKVEAGRFRSGDTIIARDGDTHTHTRSGSEVALPARTLTFVQVYNDIKQDKPTFGSDVVRVVNARYVIN